MGWGGGAGGGIGGPGTGGGGCLRGRREEAEAGAGALLMSIFYKGNFVQFSQLISRNERATGLIATVVSASTGLPRFRRFRLLCKHLRSLLFEHPHLSSSFLFRYDGPPRRHVRGPILIVEWMCIQVRSFRGRQGLGKRRYLQTPSPYIKASCCPRTMRSCGKSGVRFNSRRID